MQITKALKSVKVRSGYVGKETSRYDKVCILLVLVAGMGRDLYSCCLAVVTARPNLFTILEPRQ